MQEPVAEGLDTVMSFTLSDRDARGRLVRLGPVLGTILSAHNNPPVIRDLLAEALVLTALIGALLKDDEGQLTVQVQADGGVADLLVCDYRGGELRGYVRYDAERFGTLSGDVSLATLFGSGYLAITFDLATDKQRYQGVVPIEGHSLADACQNYFIRSEQIPTFIRIGVRPSPGGMIAGGLLLQHLPDGEDSRERHHVRLDHPEWEHVASLAGTTSWDELTDTALPLSALLWRLFHEEKEVRVIEGAQLTRGCRCNVEHFRSILTKFQADDIDQMRDEDGQISVDCAFCSRLFAIDI